MVAGGLRRDFRRSTVGGFCTSISGVERWYDVRHPTQERGVVLPLRVKMDFVVHPVRTLSFLQVQ